MEFGLAMFHVDFDAHGFRRRCDIRPIGQEVAVFEREVEERGEHLGGQLFRDMLDPVDLFTDWQCIQNGADALADQCLDIAELRWRHSRLDRLTLDVMYRRILRNEHGGIEIVRRVANHDIPVG